MSLLLTPVVLSIGVYFMILFVPAVLLLVPSLLIFGVVAGLARLAGRTSRAIGGGTPTVKDEHRRGSSFPGWSTRGV